MLKELSVKEALTLLAEKYPEPIEGWFWGKDNSRYNGFLAYVNTEKTDNPFSMADGSFSYKHFAIEIEPEYRYMTQQECLDWVCLNAHKGYQANFKRLMSDWTHVCDWVYDEPEAMLYRTIQEIDGKIVYGTPTEFKVKV